MQNKKHLQVGALFASKSLVQLLANPLVNPHNHHQWIPSHLKVVKVVKVIHQGGCSDRALWLLCPLCLWHWISSPLFLEYFRFGILFSFIIFITIDIPLSVLNVWLVHLPVSSKSRPRTWLRRHCSCRHGQVFGVGRSQVAILVRMLLGDYCL